MGVVTRWSGWKRASRSRVAVAVAASVITLAVAGSLAAASIPDSNGVIHACYKPSTGAVKIVVSASNCGKGEVHLSWNHTGPAGKDGRDGTDGQDGADGAPGNLALAGKQCPNGSFVTGFDAGGELQCGMPAGSGSGGTGSDPGSPTDADNDGFTSGSGGDCDDGNPAVHPGATELEDGLDNNCDGTADEGYNEGVPCDDGDPYTNDGVVSGESCTHTPIDDADFDGDGFVASQVGGNDCDDSEPGVHPGAAELDDGVDNDCQGGIDEGPEVRNETDDPTEADYCRIQYPSELTVAAGQSSDPVFGLLYEAGVTETFGPASSVTAQVGYGPQDTDPRSAPGWVFSTASYSAQNANDDEFAATITAPLEPGQYSFVYRFSIDSGVSVTYCDLDGAGSQPDNVFNPNVLGTMVVI